MITAVGINVVGAGVADTVTGITDGVTESGGVSVVVGGWVEVAVGSTVCVGATSVTVGVTVAVAVHVIEGIAVAVYLAVASGVAVPSCASTTPNPNQPKRIVSRKRLPLKTAWMGDTVNLVLNTTALP
jgi:hypothetical protein